MAPPAYGKSVGKGGSVMITLDELERIKNQVSKSNVEPYITMRNEDRQALHERSKGRIKNWSNTLEATRIKREEDRIKRLEDEEVSHFSACGCMTTFLVCRLRGVRSTPRSKSSRTSCAASRSRKLTDNSTTGRTWSRLSSPRCSSQTS